MVDFDEKRNFIRPEVIEKASFEDLFNKRRDEFLRLMELEGESYNLEPSDPVFKIIEVEALREMTRRTEDNYRLSQSFVAFAEKGALDALGALVGTYRDISKEESDASLRSRILSANERYSTAGSYAGYVYHASEGLEFSQNELDEGLYREAIIDIFPHRADGDKSETRINVSVVFEQELKKELRERLKAKIESKLLSTEIKPLGDFVTVEVCSVDKLSVEAEVRVRTTGVSAQVRNKVLFEMDKFKAQLFKAGEDLKIHALISQFYVDGVVEADVKSLKKQSYDVNGKKDGELESIDIQDIEVPNNKAILIGDVKISITELARGMKVEE